ncbi:MAG TPA: hypothetical protein VKD26_12330 [Streptosporangiaceae bacterium]|nr:hypothetical protein [Streptosporangiaceae bacterium]
MSGGRLTSRGPGDGGETGTAVPARQVGRAPSAGAGPVAAESAAAGSVARDEAGPVTWWRRRPMGGAVAHLAVLLGFTTAGIAVTWPRVTYLSGRLPNTRDQASYVWDMWWMARQIGQFANPFTTHQIIAPVGAPLAYHALMPLLGLLMMPVTRTAGAAFAVNLLSVILPGLLCYAMYRAARLWLPVSGALASGALFGLSSMLTWRAWFHLNIAAGLLFLPIALEAAVRLRRQPSRRRAAALGLVLGLSLLVDSEGAILAVIVTAVALAPWLVSRPARGPASPASAAGTTSPVSTVSTVSTVSAAGIAHKLRLLLLGAGVALVIASPQIAAMVAQASALASKPATLADNYVTYGVAFPQIFAPSPRVAAFGLNGLGTLFYHGITTEGVPTFGVTLTALALLGAVAAWRQRRARIWLLLWAAGALLALGPVLYIGTRPYAPLATADHGHAMSLLLPYTWFVRLPGMSGFREANRFTPLALIPAVLLAGTAVTWIKARFAPALLVVAALAALELGWSAEGPTGVMAAGRPAVDRAIAADHSGSLVVDVPLGFRSGTLELGPGFPAEELVQAPLDGHPRAVGYVARLPQQTITALRRHRFYVDLMRVQEGQAAEPATITAALADARAMRVGWVLVWQPITPALAHFLGQTGFRPSYRADGVTVYRASAAAAAALR